jgi:hypothetical protein
MVMLGGGFKSGHTLSKKDLMKAQRTRLINKALKQKGLPTLTASQKGKLNRGEITEKQLLKGAGLLGSLGSIGDSIFGLGEGGAVRRRVRGRRPRKMAGSGLLGSLGEIGDSVFGLGEGGFDSTMQYIAGGRARGSRGSRKRMTGAGLFSKLGSLAKKGVSHLASNPDLVNAGIGLLQNVLGKGGVSMGGVEMGGVEMGGAMRRRGRGRPRKHMAGSGLLGSLGEIGDSVFGLGEGGFDSTMQYIAGGAKRGRGRPRKHMAGSGLLGTLGSVGDSIFGLGEGVRRGRGRPRKHRGGVSMGGKDMYFSGL